MRVLSVIISSAFLLSARPALATVAADIPCGAGSTPSTCVVTVSVSVTPGSTLDFSPKTLVVAPSGTLDAGGGAMVIRAANVRLQPGALVVSTNGTIDIEAPGTIEVQGADSRARVDVTGSSAGSITLTAGGAVTVDGRLVADATLTAGDGGTIEVTGSAVTIGPNARLSAMGGQAGVGGEVDLITTQLGISIAGLLDASGGDGGFVSIDAFTNVVTTADSEINVKSGVAGGGDGAEILAGGDVSLAGDILGSAPGDIDLGGGIGADVEVDAVGTITFDGAIDVIGGGPFASGGNVDFTTDGDILVRGLADASAAGTDGFAGSMTFTSGDGMIVISGDLMAVGPALGGTISGFTFGDVTVSGELVTNGRNASIDMTGCDVAVTAAGRLSSVGTGGINFLSASGQMTVAGTLVAGASNRLDFRDPTKPPVRTGSITPAPTVMLNPLLIPCGGPPPTTSTTMPSTTTTTTTTSTTTRPTTTSTTVTTSTSLPPTTSTTTSTSTTTTQSSSTTTTRPTTTSTSSSTTSTTSPSTTTTSTSPSTSTTTATSSTSTSSTSTSSASTSSTTTSSSGTSSTSTSSTATSSTGTSSTSTTATTSTTTSSTSTSTSSTSTTVTTTTTTSSSPPTTTTTSTAPPTSTTTTTIPPPGCDGLAGFEVVICETQVLATLVGSLTPQEVGGVARQRELLKSLARVVRLIERAETARGRLAKANPRRARHILLRFVHVIDRALERGTISFEVASQLKTLANDLRARIAALAGVGP